MPGTIQVSVLDFKGLASSSRVSIKVSKGKMEYQTWDKGEFSFPVTTLRDNLIITIQDAEGIEISRTGVETRLVVEKGVWDDIFSFEGGGHVHMKLQFVLNEEERQRIRIMRESALKKKQEELRSSGHGSYINASISLSEVSGSQESSLQSGLLVANEASQVYVPLNSLKDAKFDNGSLEKASVGNSKDSGSLQNGLLANEASQVSVPLSKNKDDKLDIDNRDTKQKRTDSVPSKLERHDDSKKTGPAGKAHSKVKNMISAFEGSVYQDVRPPIKPPPKISQMRKTGSDSSLVNSYLKEVETEKIIPPKVTLGTMNREKVKTFGSMEPISVASSPIETEQLKDRFKAKERVVKEEKKHSKDFERASTMENSVFSQRTLDKYSKGKQSWNLSSAKQHPRRKSITKVGGEENFRKDPREAEGNSNGKLEPVAIWSDDHCSIGSSGLWIFPGEVKGSCITTGSKQIFDLTGDLWDETNTNQIKLSACDPKNTGEVNDADGSDEDGKTCSEKLRPRVETSMDPEESIGPFGQVIKVVIMVGFATLVLLTGKRTYRYSYLNPLPVVQVQWGMFQSCKSNFLL